MWLCSQPSGGVAHLNEASRQAHPGDRSSGGEEGLGSNKGQLEVAVENEERLHGLSPTNKYVPLGSWLVGHLVFFAYLSFLT